MQLTKNRLRQIIKEELGRVLSEQRPEVTGDAQAGRYDLEEMGAVGLSREISALARGRRSDTLLDIPGLQRLGLEIRQAIRKNPYAKTTAGGDPGFSVRLVLKHRPEDRGLEYGEFDEVLHAQAKLPEIAERLLSPEALAAIEGAVMSFNDDNGGLGPVVSYDGSTAQRLRASDGSDFTHGSLVGDFRVNAVTGDRA